MWCWKFQGTDIPSSPSSFPLSSYSLVLVLILAVSLKSLRDLFFNPNEDSLNRGFLRFVAFMSVCLIADMPNVYGFGFGGNEPLESVDPSTDGVATYSPPPLAEFNDTPDPDGTGEAVMPRPKIPVCDPVDPCWGAPKLPVVSGVIGFESGLRGCPCEECGRRI